MEIGELLAFSVNNKASDLHLSTGMPPMIRVDGELCPLDMPAMDNKTVKALAYDIMTDLQRKNFEMDWEIDFAFEIPEMSRFRVNVYQQNLGVAAALRIVPRNIRSLEEIDAPEVFKEFTSYPRGLVLVTGPTGSGKSTTLAAMLDYINTTRRQHVITIEDPIEFLHASKKCLINHREVYRDTKAFSKALRSALREDPDVILVGELRDLETIRMALTAAETGHLVFSTLHTSSASKTIDRLIDVFPGEEKDMVRGMLSESLKAVISQTLLKRQEGQGRVAAHEVMVCNAAIRNLIREGKVAQMYSAIQTGRDLGMHTLDQNLQELISKKIISKEIAQTKAVNKALFK